MTPDERDRFRRLLTDRLSEIRSLSEGSSDSRKAVELDQQVMGRLSRQDALQQQAMANAQEVRRHAEARKIELALKRIDEDEFGYCAECGEAIATRRLEIDSTAELCVSCASG